MGAVLQMDDYKKEVGELSFEDLYGLEYEKMILSSLQSFEGMDELLMLPNTRLFLFTGPSGYGKHTLAHAFAVELSEMDYEFFSVDGELLAEEENAAEILSALFRQMLIETNPEDEEGNQIAHRKCYLLLEHLDKLCEDRKACTILSRIFSVLNDEYQEYCCHDLVIAATAADLGDIPEQIRVHLQVMELQPPKEMERQEYFEYELTLKVEVDGETYEFIPVAADDPEMYLSQLTNGFSYAELRKVAMLIKMYYKQTMNDLYSGDFEGAEKDIKNSKNYVSEDYVKRIVNRIKMEKQAANRKQNMQAQQLAPQIVYVNGDGQITCSQRQIQLLPTSRKDRKITITMTL